METPWTISSVKRELPNVPVTIGKTKTFAKLSGRLCEYACLTVFADNTSYLRGRPYQDWHYAWKTIVNALNSNKPIKLT